MEIITIHPECDIGITISKEHESCTNPSTKGIGTFQWSVPAETGSFYILAFEEVLIEGVDVFPSKSNSTNVSEVVSALVGETINHRKKFLNG